MHGYARKCQRLDLRPERCPPLNNLSFQDLRSAGNTSLFLGLFDVTRRGAVAGEASVPGVCPRTVLNEVSTEVNTEVNPVIMPCKLSKTGHKLSKFSKTGPKLSKMRLKHADTLGEVYG